MDKFTWVNKRVPESKLIIAYGSDIHEAFSSLDSEKRLEVIFCELEKVEMCNESPSNPEYKK